MADETRQDNRFSRIEEIYHEALRLPEEERSAYIAQACAGDDDLRREVERLLSFDKKAGRFMESPALDVAAQALARKAERGKSVDFMGQTLLHYEVMEKVGEGGMGVVYKALDTHLKRPVAIKVLPPERVADPERRLRFTQEARAASALNHPNIVTIYDIDQAGGADFIAMEYVSGKTLGELIPRKGMKLGEVLKYSVQLADALAAAHAAGIVHRDLKPANVMVTDKGLVKVLDFGLAKLIEPLESDEFRTTETLQPHTEEGTIVGTVAYMSPEQAEGKKVDARSDIFSFGSVLYEMITGHRAFEGDSRISTLSAILHQEPRPVGAITQGIPVDLEKVIDRCLRKDPERRIQHMDDVKLALEEIKEDLDSGGLQVTPAAVRRALPLRIAAIVVAVVVLIAATWYWLGRQRSAESEAPLTAVPLTSYPGYENTPSFSPDGNYVAFEWRKEGPAVNSDIYIKQIGVEPPFRLTADPAEDVSPAWSPDGRFIAFLRWFSTSRAALMLIPPLGGQERPLEEWDLTKRDPNPYWDPPPYLSWTPDSKWLAFPSAEPGKDAAGLLLISVETLEKRRLTTSPAGSFDSTPAFSPDGRTLAFTRMSGINSGIHLLRLGENYEPQREPPILVTRDDEARWGVAWTREGGNIIFGSSTRIEKGLWRMTPSASMKPIRCAFAIGATSAPAISRQGDRLAYAAEEWDTDIYRVDLSGPGRNPGIPFKFISSTRLEYCAAYSPDGKKITFSSDRSGSYEIWVCDRDGANAVQLTSLGGDAFSRPNWSPDGRSIAFGLSVGGKGHIFVANSYGGSPRRLATEPSSGFTWPSWSRDGQSIYFRSKRSGSGAIWKIPATGGEAVQITQDGHAQDLPQESPDGKFLYYMKGDPYPQRCSVWRMPTGGGEETRVVDSTSCIGPYAVGKQGIYFITPPPDRQWAGARTDLPARRDIKFFDFSTGNTRQILTVERAIYIAVSPDDRTILYTQHGEAGSDLMLVENFR